MAGNVTSSPGCSNNGLISWWLTKGGKIIGGWVKVDWWLQNFCSLYPAGDDLQVLSKDWHHALGRNHHANWPRTDTVSDTVVAPPSDLSTALVRTLEALPQSEEGDSLPCLRGT